MVRVLSWLVVVTSVVGALACVFSRDHAALTLFFAVLFVCGLTGLRRRAPDVLADHPDDELQRKRGDLMTRWEPQHRAGGWEKPVRPPSPGSRPGGLPPRRR